MSCAVLHTGETILYDSTETQRLTWENVGEKTLEQTESLSPPSHSLSLISSPLFRLICPHLSSVCVIFTVVLLVSAAVSRSFSSRYLLCLSFSGSCLPLYPRLSLSVSARSLSLSFSTDCLRIHSSTLACSLMAVAGVLPGA